MGYLRVSGQIIQSPQSPLPTNILRGIVPTVTGWDAGEIGYAYLDDGGVFTDDTVDANDAGANDVALMPAVEVVNDAFYYGEGFSTSGPFNLLKINLGTAGVGGTVVWEYYNGAAWVALNPTDPTNGLTAVAGTYTVSWTIPADMAATTINGQNRYWVRSRVSAANFTTIPLATQIWIGRQPESLGNITDGNISTSATQGTVRMGAGLPYGYLIIDFGTPKSVIIGGKVGIWSSAGEVSISFASDNTGDPILAEYNSAPVLEKTRTTEAMVDLLATLMVRSRYVIMKFDISTAPGATVYIKIYELDAMEFYE